MRESRCAKTLRWRGFCSLVCLGMPVLWLSSCGYIGPPQYPATYIPVPVTDLNAVERGDQIMISFTIPALTTEGLVVKSVGSIDLRLGPNKEKEFNVEKWAEAATRVDVPVPAKLGPVAVTEPAGKFAGQDIIVAVRISSPKGRFSHWSNLFALTVVPLLAVPSSFSVENVAKGVLLQWRAPEGSFRIFRQEETETQPAQIGTSEKPEYLDTTTVYGKTYQYWVQAVEGKAESVMVGPKSITPKDVFPPAVPTQVSATPGLNAIELSWSRNEEPDFKCYRVYRALENGPFQLLADNVDAPNYSDHQVESHRRYRYAVVAVDQAGNESERSTIVEATAP